LIKDSRHPPKNVFPHEPFDILDSPFPHHGQHFMVILLANPCQSPILENYLAESKKLIFEIVDDFDEPAIATQ
jgi:hypothetical protein